MDLHGLDVQEEIREDDLGFRQTGVIQAMTHEATPALVEEGYGRESRRGFSCLGCLGRPFDLFFTGGHA